jgi:hypothetical protein
MVGLGMGCASQPRPIRTTPVARPIVQPAAPPARKARLAVLPVEKLLLPQVADELNNRLEHATVKDVVNTTMATVSMEVALMQLDCALPSNACYAQIAKRLEADCLLWAEIERGGGAGSGSKKSKKKKLVPTTIRVVLFDAERSAVVGQAEETFPTQVSNEDLDRLIAKATTPAPQPHPPAAPDQRAGR